MKFKFTDTEAKWLNAYMSGLAYLIASRGAKPEVVRALSKMRYKFAPNSLHVWLTTKERHLLKDVIDARLSHLLEKGSSTDEPKFLVALRKKLEGETT